jgi:hypothetical protein
MAEDPKWPSYETGPEKHMHALGIIAVNYNLFERSLYPLFSHHWERDLSENERRYLFWTYDNAQRLDAIQFAFKEREGEAEVLDRIDHLATYWSVVSEKRHLLMHSTLYKQSPLESVFTFPPIDPDVLMLSKPSKDDWATFNVMNLSLPNLRAIADQLHEGVTFARALALYLFRRDRPLRILGLGGLGSFVPPPGPAPLPDKPPIPRKLKLRQNPTFGPIAPDPRKPSRE